MEQRYIEFRRATFDEKLDMLRDYVVRYKTDNDGLSPTIRQMRDEFAISSTSVTAYYLQRLIDQGRLYRVRSEANTTGLGVPGGRWELEREIA